MANKTRAISSPVVVAIITAFAVLIATVILTAAPKAKAAETPENTPFERTVLEFSDTDTVSDVPEMEAPQTSAQPQPTAAAVDQEIQEIIPEAPAPAPTPTETPIAEESVNVEFPSLPEEPIQETTLPTFWQWNPETGEWEPITITTDHTLEEVDGKILKNGVGYTGWYAGNSCVAEYVVDGHAVEGVMPEEMLGGIIFVAGLPDGSYQFSVGNPNFTDSDGDGKYTIDSAFGRVYAPEDPYLPTFWQYDDVAEDYVAIELQNDRNHDVVDGTAVDAVTGEPDTTYNGWMAVHDQVYCLKDGESVTPVSEGSHTFRGGLDFPAGIPDGDYIFQITEEELPQYGDPFGTGTYPITYEDGESQFNCSLS